MRLLTIYTTLALTAMYAGIIGTAQAFESAWTGCVTPGGTIIHLAPGDTPLKRCSSRMQLIHLNDEAAHQNTDATHNQVASCEALHELGLSEEQIAKLGCPSTADLTRPGSVSETHVTGDNLVGNNFNVCNILKVESRPEWKDGWHWVMPGGVVAGTQGFNSINAVEFADECQEECAIDDKCIAAWLKADNPPSSHSTCRTFHYSDNPEGTEWNHFCGFDQGFGTVLGCADSIASDTTRWYVRVPEGQTLSDCDGADPAP